MPRLIIILVVAAVVFTVFAIIDCAVQPATRHRGVSKGWWIVITCVPVIGGLLWFLIGRGRASSARRAGPIAPDDDPTFLGSLGSSAEQDERIRRLEEELARLDEESSGGETQRGKTGEDDTPDGSRGAVG